MYIKILGKGMEVLYLNLPDNPTLSVCRDDDSGEWLAFLLPSTYQGAGTGEGLVLKSGSCNECHEFVHMLLKELKVEPLTLG